MSHISDIVIWSADVADESALMQRLAEAPDLRLVKLDRLFLTDSGLAAIHRVQQAGYRVFADAKIIEIPDKIMAITRKHLKHRPWMLNVMAHGLSSGRLSHEDPKRVDALKRFADACQQVGTHPCAVTLLTSKSPEAVQSEFNRRTAIEQVLYYAEFLLQAGFSHLVCSTMELAALRSEPRFDCLKAVVPGIRLPGAAAHDQARHGTPAEAVAGGADLLVMGRDLTQGHLGRNFDAVRQNLAATTETGSH